MRRAGGEGDRAVASPWLITFKNTEWLYFSFYSQYQSYICWHTWRFIENYRKHPTHKTLNTTVYSRRLQNNREIPAWDYLHTTVYRSSNSWQLQTSQRIQIQLCPICAHSRTFLVWLYYAWAPAVVSPCGQQRGDRGRIHTKMSFLSLVMKTVLYPHHFELRHTRVNKNQNPHI